MTSTATAYSHTPLALAPLLAALVLLALLLALSLYSLGWTPLAPVQSLLGLHEMAAFKLSSLAESVGLQGLGNVDWNQVQQQDSVHKGKGTHAAGTTGSTTISSAPELYPGLLNVSGNLCYLNATLQSMASLPPLMSYLQQLSSLSTYETPTPVTTALLLVLTSLNTPSTSTSRPAPLRPVALATALANSSDQRRRLMSSSEQQDAHELWGMIREAVEEEEGKVLAALAKEEEKGRGLGELIELSRAANGKKEEVVHSPAEMIEDDGAELKDPYLLLTSQRVRCMTCGYTRDVRHTSDQQVMLDVPHSAQISLYALLSEHTKMDLLSDYACRKCSILATLDKIIAQRDRLALTPSSMESPTTTSSASLPTTSTNGRASTSRSSTPTRLATNSNPFTPPSTPSTTMTQSRKDRLRKTQKLVDRLQSIVEAGDWEKELGKEFEGAGKVERVEGAAGKLVRFARTPSILPIHLSRSTYYTTSGAYKNTCLVTFPEFLNLQAFGDHAPSPSVNQEEAEEEVQSGGSTDLYRLNSLVVHYGSHHFGHYVAFRRRPLSSSSPSSSSSPAASSTNPTSPKPPTQQPEWYRISDETVSPSSLSEVLAANPVLLFYERWEGEDRRAGRIKRGARGVKARVLRRWEFGTDGGDGAGDRDGQGSGEGKGKGEGREGKKEEDCLKLGKVCRT